jgi:hypothetical protein
MKDVIVILCAICFFVAIPYAIVKLLDWLFEKGIIS